MSSSQLDELCCPICLEPYDQPKSLPCGHSLCANCATKVSNGKGVIVCPECRKEAVIPSDGLPTNFVLKGLVANMSRLTTPSAPPNTPEEGVKCCDCSIFCAPVDAWLCTRCVKDNQFEGSVFCARCMLENHKKHKSQKYLDFVKQNQDQLIKTLEGFEQMLNEHMPGFLDSSKHVTESSDSLAQILQALGAACVHLRQELEVGNISGQTCVEKIKEVADVKKTAVEILNKTAKSQKSLFRELQAGVEKILPEKGRNLFGIHEKLVLNPNPPTDCWKCGKPGCDTTSCDLNTVSTLEYLMSKEMVSAAQKMALSAVLEATSENQISELLSTEFCGKFQGLWHCVTRGGGADHLGLWFFSSKYISMRIGQVKLTLFSTGNESNK